MSDPAGSKSDESASGSIVAASKHGQATAELGVCVQAWRVNHPPVRGSTCMGTRPLVHVGFLKSWLAGGLNQKVLAAVLRAVQQCRKQSEPSVKITVYVTGDHNPFHPNAHRSSCRWCTLCQGVKIVMIKNMPKYLCDYMVPSSFSAAV